MTKGLADVYYIQTTNFMIIAAGYFLCTTIHSFILSVLSWPEKWRNQSLSQEYCAQGENIYPGMDTSPCSTMFFIQIFWCSIINWFLLLCIEDRGGVYRRAPGSTAVEWSGHFGPAAWSACVSIRKIQTLCKVRTNLVFEWVLDYCVPWSVLQGTVMPYGQMSQVLELLLGSFQCCVYSVFFFVFFSLVKWVTDPEMLCFTSLLY